MKKTIALVAEAVHQKEAVASCHLILIPANAAHDGSWKIFHFIDILFGVE
jgi:hypothetical protein